MPFILATKLGMTRIFDETGKVIPVTLLEFGENTVVDVKTKERDGYEAVQIGFGRKKGLSKPEKGQRKGLGDFKWLREFKTSSGDKLSIGDKVNIGGFKVGEAVNVAGVSKSKGFQGVVKRHGFHGGPASHGQKDRHRAPGSIGATHPQHVIKGKKLPGRMGGERITVKNLAVAALDPENGFIALRGAVPGKRGDLLEVRTLK